MLSEQSTRWIINNTLQSKGWNLNIGDKERNVFFEKKELSEYYQKKLNGKSPDYSLFDKKGNIIGIIEAKNPNKSLEEALNQGINYAKKLGAEFVLAANGIFCKTYHIRSEKPLVIDNDEVKEILRYQDALNFVKHGRNYLETMPSNVKRSREELLSVFEQVDNYLWEDNIQAGLPRFLEFANLLFLKLLGEHEDRSFWFELKKESNKIDYMNKIIIPKLIKAYKAEDVFVESQIRKERTIKKIFDALDELHLTTTKTDIKGDAFEYFLKNSTSTKNDLGQYFTPRHIVKAMVQLVAPTIEDTIYDPFCGTGGFLTESFNYIRETTKNIEKNKEKFKHLKQNVLFGRDASVSARIAKMNAILHGDGHSGIEQVVDSLEKPINKKYSVGLTNIPFSQNKKNNEYTRLYENGLAKNNGDAICILHLFKAIENGGRMAVVVPEGFLFRKELNNVRKFLTDNADLELVVSLPQGVFLPYTAVKTDIIYFSNIRHSKKQKNFFYFFEVKNDGFTLNNHRRKIEGYNDLDTLCSVNLQEDTKKVLKNKGYHDIQFKEVKDNNHNLVGKNYITSRNSRNLGFVSLKEMERNKWIFVKKGQLITKEKSKPGEIPVIAGGKISPYFHNQSNCDGDVITVSASGSAGYVWYHENPIWASDCTVIKSSDQQVILTKYLYFLLKGKQDEIYKLQHGTVQPHVYWSDLSSFEIPLISPDKQMKIIKELENYEKIIFGLKEFVKKWQLNPIIDDKWSILNLSEVVNIKGGKRIPKGFTYSNTKTSYPYIRVENFGDYYVNVENLKYIDRITQSKISKYIAKEGDILLSIAGTTGLTVMVKEELDGKNFTENAVKLTVKDLNQLMPEYLLFILKSDFCREQMKSKTKTLTIPKLALYEVSNLKIPIPPVKIQKDFIKDINEELDMIEFQKKLIKTFQKKIKDRLNSLWD